MTWTSRVGALMLACLTTAIITWPQALHLASAVSAHHDAAFSMWRLAWLAHAVVQQPAHLFDANIFLPASRTLAFSDATLLQGALAAPLIWAGVPLGLTYNLLLMGGIATSALAMMGLVRHLTRSDAAAVAAGVAFAALPYRVEHAMHLELQWSAFIPLTWWTLHRLIERPTYRRGGACGLMVALQFLACVYYGILLVLVLALTAPVYWWYAGTERLRPTVPALLCGAAVAICLAVPYLLLYAAAARIVGSRETAEVARYSATLNSFLASPPTSVWWGWTADKWGSAELRLFPGLATLLLGAFGLWWQQRRAVALYAAVVMVATAVACGTHGPVIPLLTAALPALQGLRALARAAIIAEAALSVLAGFGVAWVLGRLRRRPHLQRALAVACVAGILGEALQHPMPLAAAPATHPTDAYRVLARAPEGHVLELPLPALDALPGHEPMYQLWSTWHWRRLVNGYSGYYPPDYLDAVPTLSAFPDDASVAWLRARDVRYVLIHRALYDASSLGALTLAVARRADLASMGTWRAPDGAADLISLGP